MKNLRTRSSRSGKLLAAAGLSVFLTLAAAGPSLAATATDSAKATASPSETYTSGVIDSEVAADPSLAAEPVAAADTMSTTSVQRVHRLMGCSISWAFVTWSVTADVTIAYLPGTSYRWIESTANARTALTGFTVGMYESNSTASASIASGGASARVAGAATINYQAYVPGPGW